MTIKSMRYCLTLFALLAALLSLTDTSTLAATGTEAPAARMNAALAVQVARAFCARIGEPIPISVTGTAAFSADALGPPSHYWQPIWDVSFSGHAEVEVVDTTGVTSKYRNSAYSILHRDNIPAGEALPQQEAILRAKDALDATGQTEPLLFWQASLDRYSDPLLANTSVWSVRWHRAAGGVPYRGQHASVGMDSETGEIRNVVLMFGTAPLVSAVQAISQQDAINIAALRIISQGIEQGATHSGTKLEIITPDHGWNNLHGRSGSASDVRLAWVSTFVVDGHWREVYTDAATGEILGGDRDNGPAGMLTVAVPKAAPAPPPLTAMLSSARAVYVRGRDAKGGWNAKPLLKFTAKSQPQAIALLAKTTGFRKEGPLEAAPQELIVVGKSDAIGVYPYFPETGLLGSSSEWAAVPDEFKAWMQRKIAATGSALTRGVKK